jgi:flagellar protein FlaG
MELRATGNAAPAVLHPTAVAGTAAAQPAPAAAPKAGPPKAAAEPDPAEVTKAVGEINKAMQVLSRNIEFSIDADSQRTIVKVIDQETKEVIRQMPSAEALEIGKALQKVQGLLIRQTA